MKTYEEWENEVESDLNDTCEPLKIGSLEYLAGSTLREIDPIAFRQIVLDFMYERGGENENKAAKVRKLSTLRYHRGDGVLAMYFGINFLLVINLK